MLSKQLLISPHILTDGREEIKKKSKGEMKNDRSLSWISFSSIPLMYYRGCTVERKLVVVDNYVVFLAS